MVDTLIKTVKLLDEMVDIAFKKYETPLKLWSDVSKEFWARKHRNKFPSPWGAVYGNIGFIPKTKV